MNKGWKIVDNNLEITSPIIGMLFLNQKVKYRMNGIICTGELNGCYSNGFGIMDTSKLVPHRITNSIIVSHDQVWGVIKYCKNESWCWVDPSKSVSSFIVGTEGDSDYQMKNNSYFNGNFSIICQNTKEAQEIILWIKGETK